MPTYEYECSRGHHFEVVQRITEAPLSRCKLCRSKVRRLISATGFILKGGGWYQDGYSSSGNNGRKGKDNGASPGEKASGEKTSSEPSKGKAQPASSDNS
jgi:putative FmdB family regulatory protein